MRYAIVFLVFLVPGGSAFQAMRPLASPWRLPSLPTKPKSPSSLPLQSTTNGITNTTTATSPTLDTVFSPHEVPSQRTSITENTLDKEPLFERFGRGISRDFKARLPLYASDIKDGLNVQCLAATMFLFFACLAPAVGFGSLFFVATDGAIGTVEMISSTAASGLLYALLSVQPLTIIGATGPLLSFVATLAQLARSASLPFLPLYAWTGLWTAGILGIAAATSSSNLVQYLTRFTDEIFSLLISVIFVIEAVANIAGTFIDPSSNFSKALLTTVCAALTYSLATALKGFRKSTFLTRRVRETISNFGPTIGVVAATLVARWARLAHGTGMAGLPTLAVPSVFGTSTGRPWLVPLLDLPVWARWASFFPALMATVLIFLDQNITVRLVNNPRWKMTKGRRKGNVIDGMHGTSRCSYALSKVLVSHVLSTADLLVVAALTAIQSVLGLPWLVAATVRSLSHVNAVTKVDRKGNVISSMEQRVTGSMIHTLIGSCVLFSGPRQLLGQLPLPVLMGLFLYLGISSLPGNEMWERVKGMLEDSAVASEKRWTKLVPRRSVNAFTLIQVACLGAMLYVKESPIGVLFPIVIAMLAPLRFALDRVLKKEYVAILDSE